MWHAIIRGSVSSSIRSSSQTSSNKIPTDNSPSSQDGLTDQSPSAINDDIKADSDNTDTNQPHPSVKPDQNNNQPHPSAKPDQNKNDDDYNLNKCMNKGRLTTQVLDEPPPSPHMNEKLNTSPSTSSVRTLRANRSLLDIAASRPSYNLDRSSVLIGSEGQLRPDNDDDGKFLGNTDDDDDNNNDNNKDDMTSMSNGEKEYKDTTVGTMDGNNHQWNDKKNQRQATIITIPSRASKQQPIVDASMTKLRPHHIAIAPKPMPEGFIEKPIEKPKRKRRWENVSPPTSPNKKNYEMSLATIAEPQKRKPTGVELPRPHACPLCDRRFNRRYNLTAHIRVHDPDRKKLFDCPNCDQSFDRKHDRDRHSDALHHEHKHRCYCHLCDASFTRRDALTRHIQKLHTLPQSEPKPEHTSSRPFFTNP